MTKKILKVGVIGLGVGEQHILGYQNHPNCEVKKLCDFDNQKLEEVKNRYPHYLYTSDENDILDDPEIDIVSIASYDNYHSRQILKSLENKKNVFVEKPLCLHEEEFISISKSLKNNKELCLSSNLILRYTPRFINLKSKLSKDQLGKIYLMEASYDYGRIHKIISGWRGEIPFYSVMHGGGIHLIDLLLWLTNEKIIEVNAIGTKIATQNTQFKYPDCMTALIKFENGAIGSITSNYSAMIPHGHRISLYGTKSTFHHGPLGCAYFSSRDPSSEPILINDPYPGSSKGDMIPKFVDNILDREIPPAVTSQEVLNSMAVSLAIEKSYKYKMPQMVKYISITN